jgi:hypothetical protein
MCNQRADRELGEQVIVTRTKEDLRYQHGSGRDKIRSTAAPTTIWSLEALLWTIKDDRKKKTSKDLEVHSGLEGWMAKRTLSTMLHA